MATAAAGSVNGKYDSRNPMIYSINFYVGGIQYPQTHINPLLNPSQAFRELQMANGSFNSTQFQSSITPGRYCVLATGGVATAATTTAGTQEWN